MYSLSTFFSGKKGPSSKASEFFISGWKTNKGPGDSGLSSITISYSPSEFLLSRLVLEAAFLLEFFTSFTFVSSEVVDTLESLWLLLLWILLN